MKELKYKPIGAYILIKEVAPEEKKSKLGLIIESNPESDSKIGEAIVIKHGTGVMLSNGSYTQFSTQIGQRVKYRKFASLKVEIEGQNFIQLYESDLLGVYPMEELENEGKFKYASEILDKS